MGGSASRTFTIVTLVMLQFLISGCLDGKSDRSENDASATDSTPAPGGNGAPPPTVGSSNTAPEISGSPPAAATIGSHYRYTPDVRDRDGDTLSFSVENLPKWARFNSLNGSIVGVPPLGSEGRYQNIKVSVSDGQATTSTRRFSVIVVQDSLGSVSLSWLPPNPERRWHGTY